MPVRTSPAPFLTLLALALGCGGGSTSPTPPPPPPPPAAVASVTLDQSDLGMVPQFTVQLTATPKDASGNPLAGRTVTWQSTAATVASVSNTGLVTGLTTGTAVITATSEAKTASANVIVREGAVVGPAGGTVIAAGGKAKLTIPAGALPSPLPISVTPLPTPPSPTGVLPNTAYELGPTGTTFAAPVQLEFLYTPKNGIDSTQALYRLSRYTNGAWVPLPGSSGGRPGGKVTAPTSSFSTYGIFWIPVVPALTVTPNLPLVYVGQTKQLTATSDPQWAPWFAGSVVTRSWSGNANASVNPTGLVTGIIPTPSALISVADRHAIPCPTPCYVGTLNFGLPTQQDLFTDSMYVVATGNADLTVALIPVQAITITPAQLTLAPGQKSTVTATLKDAGGSALSQQFRTLVWSTSNAAVASVAQTGEITAVSVGPATISVTSDGVTGSTQVTVATSTSPVVTVDVRPDLPKIEVGSTLPLIVTPRDLGGQPVTGRPVVWSSDDPNVVTITQNGAITGVSAGTAIIRATVDGVEGGTFVTVVPPYPLVLGSPAVGDFHSCLLRTNNTVWCWGKGTLGQIGNGGNPTAQLVPVQVSGAFKALSAGRDQTCALDLGGGPLCWGDILGDNAVIGNNVPTPVPGGATFAKIFVGAFQACGLAADGTASCWGAAGRLGDGTNVNSTSPVLVVGGLKFATLAVGFSGACGLTQAGATWCWGNAFPGGSPSLGDGSTVTSFVPVPVAAGHQFTSITGGTGFQTCGIKANGEAWCWGRGSEGQLGDGSVANRATPVKVATTVKFIAITAGASHTCALAEDHTAWCWGLRGNLGSLAPTTLPLYVTTPIQVYGGRQFTEIDAGVGAHTCARAADGTWCWGSDLSGELGTGVANAGTFGPPVKVRFP